MLKTPQQYAIMAVFSALVTVVPFAVGAVESQAELLKVAKITKAQAVQIAQAKVPAGVIKSAELERENGQLMWSFDMATAGTHNITEVDVDAMTGNVLAVNEETPAMEKAEAAAEQKQK